MNIFVYGTLRPSLYPRRYLNGSIVERATLQDKFLMVDLGQFPALVEAEIEHRIVGETFEIDHEQLQRYDSYEGYLPNGSGLYDRREVAINVADKTEQVRAWVYFMQAKKFQEDDLSWAAPVPSGDWADVKAEKDRKETQRGATSQVR